MSRKQNIAAQKVLAEQAIYQKQCAVWMRSLQRNDSDIAAVVELNRSLHVVKNAFINTYNNELLLLHIGQGKYRLSPDGSDCLVKPVLISPQPPASKPTSPTKSASVSIAATNSPSTPGNASIANASSSAQPSNSNNTILQYQAIPDDEISAEQQELCVDFLLRKKLRRKLISRIIRRLQRIATSMDHLEQMTIPSSTSAINPNTIIDVVAPAGPPKYGDLRLYCDPIAVQEFAQVRQKQMQAWQHIIATREQDEYGFIDNENELMGSSGGKVSSASPLSSPKRHIVKSPASAVHSKTAPSIPEDTRKENSASVDVKSNDDHEKEEEMLRQNESTPPVKIEEDNQGEEEQESKIDSVSVTTKAEPHESSIIDTADIPTVLSNSVVGNVETTTTTSGDDAVKEAPLVVPSSTIVATEAAKPSTTDIINDPALTTTEDHTDTLAADYELFLDYKDAYEKLISSVIPVEEGSVVPDGSNVASFLQSLPPGKMNVDYTILQNQRDEDYMIIKNGIGATHPNMSIQEREAEYHKWESNLLSRIPEQPTYAELGYENRVFFYEDRLQRALEKQNGQGTQEQRDETVSSEQINGNVDEKMDVDDENAPDKNEVETGTLNENEDRMKDENEMDDAIDKDTAAAETTKDEETTTADDKAPEPVDEGVKNDETEKELDKVEPKQLRPISLVAIPSFYEQDLKRIKLVQAELLASSMREHAIHRLEEVTGEFNQCLNNSMELANQRTYLQNQVNQLSQQIRALTQSVQSDYMVQVSLAKNRWNLDRCSFETTKLNQMLPSRNGIMPNGSIMTQSYRSRPDRIAVGLNEIVSTCVADIIDCVDNVGNGRVRLERFQEPFVLPTPSADVDALQRAKQLETTKRNDLNTCTLKLRTSEGERLRAWRKMLKTKMEFDIPHQHFSSTGQPRLIRLDPNLCSTLQLPALHQTAAQDVPQELPDQAAVATYTPMHTARTQPSQVPLSESKYSTARVRERIASDGTVAPVTKPKMTADGLYLRPAGRTRKGMEWDAVRGIWIPASEMGTLQYSRD